MLIGIYGRRVSDEGHNKRERKLQEGLTNFQKIDYICGMNPSKISVTRIIVWLLTVLLLCSCVMSGGDNENRLSDIEVEKVLNRNLGMFTEDCDSGRIDLFIDSLFRNVGHDIRPYILRELCLGYMAASKGDINRSFNHFEKARIEAETLGADGKAYSAMVYNALGIYYLELLSDVSSSIQSFSMALDFQRQIQAGEGAISRTLSNLAGAYAESKDTAGLSFAVEAFDMARGAGDTAVIINSGLKAAYFYALKKETGRSRSYLGQIGAIVEQSSSRRLKAEIWSRYGSIYQAENKTDSALCCFNRAIELSDDSKPYEQAGMMISKGNLLYEAGRPKESFEILNRALRIAGKNKIIYQTSQIFSRLADCHNAMSNHRQATRMMFIFKNFEDSIHSASRERTMNMLRIRDEVLLHKVIIQKQETALERKERSIAIILSVCASLLIIVGFMVYLYFKKRHLFSIIVKQNRDYENRQRELCGYIEELRSSEKDGGASISGTQVDNIMKRLDELLNDETVITDSGLSLSSVAERLDTNRTYLSQAVKEATGESFPTLIRSRRVKKAIEYISRNETDLPLKEICRMSGFSSMSAFHTAFRNETGMTPNTYRNELRRL